MFASFISLLIVAFIHRSGGFMNHVPRFTRMISKKNKLQVTSVQADNISPVSEKIVKETSFDKFRIYILSKVLTSQAAEKSAVQPYVFPGMSFTNFTDASKVMLHQTTPLDLHLRIVRLLKALVPGIFRFVFRRAYRYFPKLSAQTSAFAMDIGWFDWLVGPSERQMVEIVRENKETEQWKSSVHLKECKYLKEAGCKSACIFLCKGPTQDFFNSELGMPVYMKPNFTDNSCDLQFGVIPPASNDDPAYVEPCFFTCSSKKNPPKRDFNFTYDS